MQSYKWTIVGAGPAGIAAVGKLLDNGADPKAVIWIDPAFRVGDLGTKWRNVSGNTKLYRLVMFLKHCSSFNYDEAEANFALNHLDPNGTYQLRYAAEPMRFISGQLRDRVDSREGMVSGLNFKDNQWHVELKGMERIAADNVVLAVGSEPKKLDHKKPVVDLEHALDPGKLAGIVGCDDVFGVFGSSHSAIMAVRNLFDAGVRQVVNFYKGPVRYAVDHGDWVLHDNTGLKGETAAWARENIDSKNLAGLLRVEATLENIDRYLPRCSHVVYGIGFQPRSIPIEGIEIAGYDPKTGIIGPGLFGCGIAYPEMVVDPRGNVEYNVGILKFIRYLDRVVPQWIGMGNAAQALEEENFSTALRKP